MENLQNALQKMGSNFLVASFVPAMGFVTLSIIFFLPIMPPSVLTYWEQINKSFFQTTIVILLFTTLLGFTLFTLSTYIYKAFEGYTFILSSSTSLGKAGIQRQKRRAKEMELKLRRTNRAIRKLDEDIELLEKKPKRKWKPSDYSRYSSFTQEKMGLEEYRYGLTALYNQSYPPMNLILPTRFGNILRAAETYPANRYRIDAVELWPRLAHTIPSKGMDLVDSSHNECLFLLNSAVLSTALAIISILAAVFQLFLSQTFIASYKWIKYVSVNIPQSEYQFRIFMYIILGVISFGIAFFFYEASLLNVGQFGASIRSAYDLYRFELLKALHLRLPKTYNEEIELWDKLGNFVTLYPDENAPVDFTYNHQYKQ